MIGSVCAHASLNFDAIFYRYPGKYLHETIRERERDREKQFALSNRKENIRRDFDKKKTIIEEHVVSKSFFQDNEQH